MPRINLKFWETKKESKILEPKSYISDDSMYYSNLVPFDGEKTPLELGNPIEWRIDYFSMRKRAWEAFLSTDIVQNAINKHVMWLVGAGLKLQSEPIEGMYLGDFNTKEVEDRFRLHVGTKYSSEDNLFNLHQIIAEGVKNAILSGDCLFVVRNKKTGPSLQLIDGGSITTPLEKFTDANIKQGVHLDSEGNHLGYYVKTGFGKYAYIKATNSIGQRVAWLAYGRKYKSNDVRGMSFLSAVLETSSKMDRYKDAALGAAEENNKIPYTIEHNQFSDGQNPMINQVAGSIGRGVGNATPAIDPAVLATKVAASTSKRVYNMPIGSSLRRNDHKTDVNFKDYYLVNLDIVYATLEIPAEIALDKFEGSYSSSRAALKSWEHSLNVKRVNILKQQMYKPYYDYWLDIMVLSGKIKSQGYLDALLSSDTFTLEAYRNCRFIGASVPHIDPLKEVKAEREKLGKSYQYTPLTTAENACENLNSGDFSQNINKATNEKDISNHFNPVVVPNASTTEVSTESSKE